MKRPGLYANIAKKRARIKAQKAAGKKPERMRKPGTKGAPTAASFRAAAKTARKPRRAQTISILETIKNQKPLQNHYSLSLPCGPTGNHNTP